MMASIYLVSEAQEIARRRKLVAPGLIVEAWQDLYVPGEFWVGEDSKGYLDGAGTPLAYALAVDAEAVGVYYGPRLRDVESLPDEESLRARVLSAHGIAVAWITYNQLGDRTKYEPTSPADPIFYLRRPQAVAAHIWRLFRHKREAVVYMQEYYAKDHEAREWAESLRVGNFEELMNRHGRKG